MESASQPIVEFAIYIQVSGYCANVEKEAEKKIIEAVKEYYDCYEVGEISRGDKKVVFRGNIDWK